MLDNRENMNVVIVGHVDHGKSTIIGRLLADTDSLPDGKLAFVAENCRRNSKPFEYAFLLDALKEEQNQGITIDCARCFFKTKKRNYIIIDAPGHIEFLKNMVSGAARAEAALLVIDATEGVQQNSRRHGYMLSLLGIKQVAVLINKMDLVGYDLYIYEKVKEEYSEFLQKINIHSSFFIPVSGFQGDNVAGKSLNMSWYKGPNVLQVLEGFIAEPILENKPFRMPVQSVYKFTQNGDKRRIIAGTIDSGKVMVGDEIVFYPSGKKTTVKTIEAFNEPTVYSSKAGYATGFTLTDPIYISRGELATKENELKPKVACKIKANIFWLGKEPLKKTKNYYLKLGTAQVGMRLESVIKVIDASTLEEQTKDEIIKNDVAECILTLDKDIAFDLPDDIIETSRFVIVDNFEITGGGIIQESLTDKHSRLKRQVQLRNYRWENSQISRDERAERYNQKSILLFITSSPEIPRKAYAKALERYLFDRGKMVYFLSMGNLQYGIDADIKLSSKNDKSEHFRRLAEVANLMVDAGLILIVTARELSQDDLELIELGVNREVINTVWIGEHVNTDICCDLHIANVLSESEVVNKILLFLQTKGVIFKP